MIAPESNGDASGHGKNGDADPWKKDERGRFGRGNKGGPGRPFAEHINAHRNAIADYATPERTLEVMQALFLAATLDRDIGAIKEWLQRTAGAAEAQELVDQLERLEESIREMRTKPLTKVG